MSFIKSFLASSALLATVFAHPGSTHSHAKRTEPYGSIITKCTVPGTVSLTFDDGPYIYTETLLDRLAAVGFRATFFQNGNNWESIYNYNSTLKRMIKDGHQIASHTWDHKDLATLSSAQVQSEMTQLETAYLNILGYFPYYMRPPFLSTSATALSVLGTLKYVVIEIDIDTQDWQNLETSEEPYSFSNYTAGYDAGGRLSLSHDPYATTVNGYIPELLDWLVGKNMKSVPVGECLGDPKENWYRKTRSDTYNPYGVVASSSASASPSASSSVKSSSVSSSIAKSSIVSASASPSSAASSAAASSVSKASSAVVVSSASQASSIAASSPASMASSVIASSSVAASLGASSILSSIVASAASSAIPKPSGKVSPNGACGGSKGYICEAGQCCSEYGWCGVSTDYCSAGCQSKFGACLSGDATIPTAPTGPVVESPDFTCGGMSGYTCADSMCCSQYGWCGTSKSYCSAGCQSGFGKCS